MAIACECRRGLVSFLLFLLVAVLSSAAAAVHSEGLNRTSPAVLVARPETVALVTEFRSGSTLLGNLLGSYATVYFFEPCRWLKVAQQRGKEKMDCASLAPRLLACDPALGDAVWRAVLDADRSFIARRFNVQTPAALIERCRASNRVAKIVRLDAGIPAALVDAASKTLRLVRDPRAVVNSRFQAKMCERDKAADCAHKVCKLMDRKDEDERSMGPRADYAACSFEGLVAEPRAELARIHGWLALRGDGAQNHIDYAIAQLHGASADECKPGKLCARDGAAVARKWTTELSRAQIAAIEADARCIATMRYHNYTPVVH